MTCKSCVIVPKGVRLVECGRPSSPPFSSAFAPRKGEDNFSRLVEQQHCSLSSLRKHSRFHRRESSAWTAKSLPRLASNPSTFNSRAPKRQHQTARLPVRVFRPGTAKLIIFSKIKPTSHNGSTLETPNLDLRAPANTMTTNWPNKQMLAAGLTTSIKL